jgi:uncharacterized protein YecT (DUF1311 family)/uncharacterized caspase-like protein
MKLPRLLLLLAMSMMMQGAWAQVPTQEQVQSADTQLNQVYQQVRAGMTAIQRQQLKVAQRNWINQRDAFVAQNPGNPQGALYQATMQRVGELQRLIRPTNTVGATVPRSGNPPLQAMRPAISQGPSQEQVQLADTQLNQVYQQLRGSLNDAQKQQLKLAQRDWIKKRDSFVAANPGNSQRALYQSTTQRVAELQVVLQKVRGNRVAQKKNEQGIVHTVPVNQPPSLKYNKIEPIYQEVNWHSDNVFAEAIGSKYRAITIAGSNRIYIFDSKTKLLYSSVIMNGGEQSEELPADFLCFCDNENLLFSLKYGSGTGYKDTSIQFNLIPSLENIVKWNFYKRSVTGPVLDNNNNLGVCVFPHSVIPTGYEFKSFQNAKEEEVGKWNQKNDSHQISENKYSDLSKRIGCFEFMLGDNTNITTPLEVLISDQEGMISVDSGLAAPIIEPALNPALKINRFNNKISEYYESWNTRAQGFRDKIVSADFRKNQIILHNILENRKQSFLIDLDELSVSKEKWSGPTIVENNFQEGDTLEKYNLNKTREINYSKSLDKSTVAVLREKDHKYELARIQTFIDLIDKKANKAYFAQEAGYVDFDSMGNMSNIGNIDNLEINYRVNNKEAKGFLLEIKYPKDDKYITITPLIDASKIDGTGKCNVKSVRAYCYLQPFPIIVGYWLFPEKHGSSYEFGVYNNKINKWVACKDNQRNGAAISESPSHFWDSKMGQMWLSSSNSIFQIDLNTGDSIQTYNVGKKFEVFALSDKRIFGMPRMDEKRGEIWNRDPLKKVCDILWSDDGNIMLYNDDGYYATKAKSFKSIAAKSGDSVYPFEQFDLKLNRPDIIFEDLGFPKDQIELLKTAESKRLKRMGVTEDMLQPDFHLPELQIVGDVPATTSNYQVDLQIKATDDKYPLDRLRVYVNNVPVNGRDGELLRDQKTQSLEKTIPIKLAAGRNKIQVSVLNSAGAESLYANVEVNCTAERPKPKLYAVALGVSQYDRPEWCLKYAAKDAADLVNKIKEKAGTAYSEVKPLLLTDKEVTKESTAKIKEFLSGATIDDTVLIFMAGHGILDDKYDYYFGTTDIDPAKPFERGMPYEAIDNILAEVPSLKKALLMDTCHAGELDDDEKKELAASDATTTQGVPLQSGSKVAMRAIGTRGMTVQAIQGAKGKSDWYEKLQDMFVDLRRGSGATVISSSQGAEYAFESSEQSNGLFTYALMEALDGKATPNKDGQIAISTVGDYVKKRVQDLTKGKQNPNLRGVNLEEDFALSTVQ